MIGLPPFEAGGVKETIAWPLPVAAVLIVGGPGTVTGSSVVVVDVVVEVDVVVVGATIVVVVVTLFPEEMENSPLYATLDESAVGVILSIHVDDSVPETDQL